MPDIQMRFPGGLIRALTLSYDDGVEQDERLLDIMKGSGLKGTFNLNSALLTDKEVRYPQGQIHRRISRDKALKLFLGSGQEVAVHTATHPHLEQIPLNMAAHEVMRDRLELEKLFHCIVRGMAYPFGTYSDEVVDMLAACGIAYARTVESSHGFAIPRDWLRLSATCHHNDPALMQLARDFLAPSERGDARLFYLWGHSYEFERDNNWDVIENFAAAIGHHEDVWYATNIEVYDYADAFKRLRLSCDGRILHNPTAAALWLKLGQAEIMLAPGETRTI